MDPVTGIKAAAYGMQILGGKKQKREARRAAAAALKERQAQQKKLDEEMANYKAMKFTNPYANLENTMEDLRVSTRAADFAAQRAAQGRADILGQLRGAAGSSGIAGLAQALANQGALQAQQASASIAQQEISNEQARAQMAQRIQMQKASGDAAVQQAMSSKQATILGIQQGQATGASEAYQQALKNQRAANAYANQMMIKGATGIAGMAAEGDFGSFGGSDQGVVDYNQGGTEIDVTGREGYGTYDTSDLFEDPADKLFPR